MSIFSPVNIIFRNILLVTTSGENKLGSTFCVTYLLLTYNCHNYLLITDSIHFPNIIKSGTAPSKIKCKSLSRYEPNFEFFFIFLNLIFQISYLTPWIQLVQYIPRSIVFSIAKSISSFFGFEPIQCFRARKFQKISEKFY